MNSPLEEQNDEELVLTRACSFHRSRHHRCPLDCVRRTPLPPGVKPRKAVKPWTKKKKNVVVEPYTRPTSRQSSRISKNNPNSLSTPNSEKIHIAGASRSENEESDSSESISSDNEQESSGLNKKEKDILVPIRIAIPLAQNQAIRDTMLVNLNDPLTTPEFLAKIFCEDLDIHQSYEKFIAESISNQISSFKKYRPPKTGEKLLHVNIDLNMNGYHLKDKFLWDINSNENNPEQFAKVLIADLGLPAEFGVAVAHTIREQITEVANSKNPKTFGVTLQDPITNIYREEDELINWSPNVQIQKPFVK